MSAILKKKLLAEDEFMPEMYLRQPEFTYSSCGPFTKNIEKIKKISSNRRFKIYLSKWIR